ncbi:class I SAM-dependent methyltransferase [Rhodospirillaceae bacterium SYSU D60014]|uniref:class I SAM-dependent methyltransferase n=1 Tax=Virgifigura deserti TaxID=2268457 RepID=UPI000E66EB6F
MTNPLTDPADFVRAETALAHPPLVPEIQLYLADAITPIWEATEATLAASGVPPPYWAFAWPGGQALARHILDNPALVAGRRVLDFAAGSGLGAIAAAKAGAAAVTANDIDAFAAAAIRLNAAANAVSVAVATENLLDHDDPGVDLVLAGDICYERPLAGRVEAWLKRLARRGTTVLLGDPGRAYLPRDGLEPLARYAVPTTRELEDQEVRDTVVWRVTG